MEEESKNKMEEESRKTTWNAPPILPSVQKGGDEDTTFPVIYMKQKLESMSETKEDHEPTIFEKNNYKNIELFETIHENFKKARSVKWKIKNTKNKMRKKRSNKRNSSNTPKSSCDKQAQKRKAKQNPVSVLHKIYVDSCDGVTAGIMYRESLDEVSDENKMKMEPCSKWLQSKVGEFFVVFFTIIMTLSIMFYSSGTFQTSYRNPLNIIKDIEKTASWIQPIYAVLDVLLQDVLAPFTILLNIGLNVVPSFCNAFIYFT